MIAGRTFLLTHGVLALGQAPVFRIDRTGAAIIGAIAIVIGARLSSTLAGNPTLLGSIANPVALEGARRHGETVWFGECLRAGVPITVATTALGVWWLS